MRTLIHRVPIILVVYACSIPSTANGVSFLQAPLAGADGFLSEPASDQSADNFSFVAKTKVTSVRWWGTYITSAPEPDQFTLRFFGAGTGVPQQNPSSQFTGLTVGRSDSGLVDSFGETIFQYQAQIPSPVVFSAGSTAYFSVLNTTAGGWFWQSNSNSGSNWYRFDELDPWISTTSGNLAFELTGVTPPPGDYNADFAVNPNDYSVWKQNFGSTTQLAADGNGNSAVDAADYAVWRNNLGTSLGAGTSVAVPEPTSRALVLVGIVLSVVAIAWRTNRMRATIPDRGFDC